MGGQFEQSMLVHLEPLHASTWEAEVRLSYGQLELYSKTLPHPSHPKRGRGRVKRRRRWWRRRKRKEMGIPGGKSKIPRREVTCLKESQFEEPGTSSRLVIKGSFRIHSKTSTPPMCTSNTHVTGPAPSTPPHTHRVGNDADHGFRAVLGAGGSQGGHNGSIGVE